MKLLHYEFIEGPDGSTEGMIRKLVRDIRFNRSQLSSEEFNASIPGLIVIEQRLQEQDQQSGMPFREYIGEIMQELDEEAENRREIEHILSQATTATVETLMGHSLDMTDFSYSIHKANQFYVLKFNGYADDREVDANLVIATEVFRSICNQYNYIFIDLS